MYRDHDGRGAVDMRYTAAKSMTVQKMECTEMLVESFSLRKAANKRVHAAQPPQEVRVLNSR